MGPSLGEDRGRAPPASDGAELAPRRQTQYAQQDFSPRHLRDAVHASLRRLAHGPHRRLPAPRPHARAPRPHRPALRSRRRRRRRRSSASALRLSRPPTRGSRCPGISVVQVPFGMLDPEAATTTLPLAREHGREVWARGVFGGGLLALADRDSGGPRRPPEVGPRPGPAAHRRRRRTRPVPAGVRLRPRARGRRLDGARREHVGGASAAQRRSCSPNRRSTTRVLRAALDASAAAPRGERTRERAPRGRRRRPGDRRRVRPVRRDGRDAAWSSAAFASSCSTRVCTLPAVSWFGSPAERSGGAKGWAEYSRAPPRPVHRRRRRVGLQPVARRPLELLDVGHPAVRPGGLRRTGRASTNASRGRSPTTSSFPTTTCSSRRWV